MTIQINTPNDGDTVDILANGPTGINDTGDDVSGWLLDTDTNTAYGCVGETLNPEAPPSTLWDWTLTFQTNPPTSIPARDTVIVYVYDAVNGGDGDSVTITQGGGASVAAASPWAAGPAPTANLLVAPVAGTGVSDITMTVTLQPVTVKCSVFLVALNAAGARIVLEHRMPSSTQPARTVKFRAIDMDEWDAVHAIAMIKGQKGRLSHQRVK